ncbi:MAG TPA: DUF5684 domain-containing protein [Spirochaetota bacterium]|nr:DUF5684 domain-containing protein [Spirochaetota bacterium]HPJ37345.1 DUF5684 domain-containing protein [Spirochaetota bacterium]HPQ52613.1 DUF5684 domain-containing protein [Spirochaetota bacterium]
MGGESGGFGVLGTIVYLAIIVAIIAGGWKMFEKAGKPGWAFIIPIYNLIVLLQIVGKPIWWILLFLIPLVNFIVLILIGLELVKKFGQPTWHILLFLFLSFIYIPYLGFSGSVSYRG